MKLRFPNHFQQRMVERGIDIDHIKQAIQKPDTTEKAFEGRIKVIKKVNGKTIKVVYYKEPFKDKKNEYTIITAYYLKT